MLRLFSFLHPKKDLPVRNCDYNSCNLNFACTDLLTSTVLALLPPSLPPSLLTTPSLPPSHPLPLQISLSLDGATPSQLPLSAPTAAAPKPQDATADTEATVGDGALMSGSHSYRVGDLAYLRSGDKGDSSNIGIIVDTHAYSFSLSSHNCTLFSLLSPPSLSSRHCTVCSPPSPLPPSLPPGVIARHPSYLPYLKQALTVTAIGGYFDHLMSDHTDIQRYHLPGIAALNFVLKNSLGGGGVASLRIDPQVYVGTQYCIQPSHMLL